MEEETEGVTLVSTRHGPRQFPLHPYTFGRLDTALANFLKEVKLAA
jgi:hypothetical protein